jgi:PhoH-like ATPase
MKNLNKKKVYVLDTSVIVHDHNSVNSFDEHDVVVPFVVLRELDGLKNGSAEKNFQAREFIRILDSMPDSVHNGGFVLGKGMGKFRVYSGSVNDSEFDQKVPEKTADNEILRTVNFLSKLSAHQEYILVTKDVSLRQIAKALGLNAEDYKKDKAKNLSQMLQEIKVVHLQKDLMRDFFGDKEGGGEVALSSFVLTPVSQRLTCNQFVEIKFDGIKQNKPVYAINKQVENEMRLYFIPEKLSASGIFAKNKEQLFALQALLDPGIFCVTLNGVAGTGKTLLGLATALEQVASPSGKKKKGAFNQILCTRQAVEVGRELGFLPGDSDQKLAPYMQPFWDNLSVIASISDSAASKIKKLKDTQEEGEGIKIEPIQFLRGRTLPDLVFIVDEAQNLTPSEVKTIVTRMGEGAKLIVMGDLDQVDTQYLDRDTNGLAHIMDRFKGQRIYAHINLIKTERSELSKLAAELL